MLNCVDLFAGAGGFSLAAQLAGLHVRLAVENDANALTTYRNNLCNGATAPTVMEGDISKMSPSVIYNEIFSTGEHCDLLLGGPPCQGFSTHRIKNAGISDKRNGLIHTYFEFVKTFAPSVFLMENVPGMLWPRHAAELERLYSEGAKAGYEVLEPVVLDARDFGVPQRRKRVFILGLRAGVLLGDLDWPLKATHGSPAKRLSDDSLRPWVSCDGAFKMTSLDDVNNVHMRHSAELISAFKKTPKNGGSRRDSGRVLPCHEGHDGHKDVYGRIDRRQPAPTMTTACINPSKGRFVHPTLNHGITVRQAARIQTFPDDFVFSGGLIAAGQQVGNAVPVLLGRLLIEHLKPVLAAARASRVRLDDGAKAVVSPRGANRRELAATP